MEFTAGHLGDNVAHFGRALRAAGLPVGTGRILNAVRAVGVTGFRSRQDFYWTLHACFVSRTQDRELFRQAFTMFWRDPVALEQTLALARAGLRIPTHTEPPPAAATRAAAAVIGSEWADVHAEVPPESVEVDAELTWSATERLRHRDFDQMTVTEAQQARRMIAKLAFPVPRTFSRRQHAAPDGRRPDWRQTMRTMMRTGGQILEPRHRAPTQRRPNLVVLCDISGSMGTYSRMLLHFMHAISNARDRDWGRVSCFVFGTRLTNITRWLRARDVDEALGRAGAAVPDWEGGTRIGACLHAFNRDWSRRMMSGGAGVLLLTDGLDRDDPTRLAAAAERLQLSARRVIWLNPLLRWEEFVPKARGVAALLPHVDCFRGAYNIETLEQLGATLATPDDRGDRDRLLQWLRQQ